MREALLPFHCWLAGGPIRSRARRCCPTITAKLEHQPAVARRVHGERASTAQRGWLRNAGSRFHFRPSQPKLDYFETPTRPLPPPALSSFLHPFARGKLNIATEPDQSPTPCRRLPLTRYPSVSRIDRFASSILILHAALHIGRIPHTKHIDTRGIPLQLSLSWERKVKERAS